MLRSKSKLVALMLGMLIVSGQILAADKEAAKKKSSASAEDSFYIYTDRGSRLNHYAPSGWMGDFGDLSMNQGWPKAGKSKESKNAKVDPAKQAAEDTCIQVKYSAQRKQGAGWAGVYWQHPANNWANKRGGYDLSAYSKLTFWAKGEKGGEVIDKFLIGGITGQTEEGDSDEASISPVTLTADWKKYEIPLKGLDLSHIIGGFGFALNADANPNGIAMYLDEVRLEK